MITHVTVYIDTMAIIIYRVTYSSNFNSLNMIKMYVTIYLVQKHQHILCNSNNTPACIVSWLQPCAGVHYISTPGLQM